MTHAPVIIGGGPAGAAAAILLAKAGHTPLLLEKMPEPHHKVCGEFLSWEAVHYLTRLGIDLPGLGARPIDTMTLGFGPRETEMALPFTAQSLSRFSLDAALLDQARKSGAQIRQAKVTGLDRANDKWTIHTETGAITAATVFLATGKHDLRDWKRAGASDLIGFKLHMRLTEAQTRRLQGRVCLSFFDSGYAGLECVEDGIANLCLLVRKPRFERANKDWNTLLTSIKAEAPGIAARLHDATPLWPKPLAIAGMPFGYTADDTCQPGLYPLGDQAAVIPSFAGDGMAMALHSAFTTVDCHLGGGGAQAYAQTIRQDFKQPVAMAAMISKIALTSLGRNTAGTICALWPQGARQLIDLTRLKRVA